MGRVRPEHDIDVMEEGVDNFLVLAGIELFSFLVAGGVLCFGSGDRAKRADPNCPKGCSIPHRITISSPAQLCAAESQNHTITEVGKDL